MRVMTLISTVGHVDNLVVWLLSLFVFPLDNLLSIYQLLQVATFLSSLPAPLLRKNRTVSILLRSSTQSSNIRDNVRPVDPRSDCARWFSSCKNMYQHDCASHSLSSYWRLRYRRSTDQSGCHHLQPKQHSARQKLHRDRAFRIRDNGWHVRHQRRVLYAQQDGHDQANRSDPDARNWL